MDKVLGQSRAVCSFFIPGPGDFTLQGLHCMLVGLRQQLCRLVIFPLLLFTGLVPCLSSVVPRVS